MNIATAKALSFGLRKLARNVRRRLWIASPFVGGWLATKCLIDTVWQNDPNVDVRLLTDVENKGWLDPVTIQAIANSGTVKHLRGLHAKVFIADDQALVTSANLTRTAFAQRYEIGVFLTVAESAQVIGIFQDWWKQASNPPRGWIGRLRGSASRAGRGEEPNDTHLKTLLALPEPPKEVGASPSPKQFVSLVKKADRFFVCNTDRRHAGRVAEQLMRQRGYAAAWEDFNYPGHMREVEPGNAIFMYAKGAGIIGIGRAKGSCRVLQPGDRNRLRDGDTREWRVAVDWVIWDDVHPFPWNSPNATFFDVSGEKYRRLRDGVRRQFAVQSE